MNFEERQERTVSLRDRALVQSHVASVFAREELGKRLVDTFGNDVYDLSVLSLQERNEVMIEWAARYGKAFSDFADTFPHRVRAMLTAGSGVSAVDLFQEIKQSKD